MSNSIVFPVGAFFSEKAAFLMVLPTTAASVVYNNPVDNGESSSDAAQVYGVRSEADTILVLFTPVPILTTNLWEGGRRMQIVLITNDSNFAATGLKGTLKS